MDANLLERYADLIVSVGANVQPDQVLAVEALPEAQPLVAALARRAYEKGVRYVDVQYFDPQVKRIRAQYASEGSLDWVPPWAGRRMLALGDLDSLHFEGPGTDLTVGLLPSSRFAKEGGSSQTRTGVRHLPNIPTEEVYTTPDPERTQGIVTATKPLDVAGSLVTGLRIRFDGGRAVEIDADTNVDTLRQR